MKPDVAIVGAGYVGMPLARVFADARKNVVLVDVNPDVVAGINRGESHIGDVPSGELEQLVADGRVSATTDYDVLKDAGAVIIALPTPLSSQREPRAHRERALARERHGHYRASEPQPTSRSQCRTNNRRRRSAEAPT